MLKLTYKLIVLGCIVALVMALIVRISPHDTDNYLAAAIDKQHLLDTVKSPRIILVGGSNVAFSVDSEKIAEHFGMPVINMGLHVDLGLRYMLNEVQPALRNGDILIIFPEYDHFSGLSLDGRSRELGSVIKFCSECISGISTPTQIYNVVSGIFEESESDIFRAIKKPKKNSKVYTRQGFNAWGDMVSHLEQQTSLELTEHLSQIKVSSPNPAVELLNTFYREIDTENIQVFMMFPAIPIGEYKGQEENFKALYTLIKTEAEIPIIGTPQDFVYAKKYFYDTFYHMNRFGREERTAHIINMLEPVIQK
jgi:hypothetical protein